MAFGGSGRCSTVDFAVVMVRVPKIDIGRCRHRLPPFGLTALQHPRDCSISSLRYLELVQLFRWVHYLSPRSFGPSVRCVLLLRDVVRVSSEIRTALFFGGWSASIAAFKPVSAIMGLATKQ